MKVPPGAEINETTECGWRGLWQVAGLESIRSELFRAGRHDSAGWQLAAGDTLIAGVRDHGCACVEVSMCVPIPETGL